MMIGLVGYICGVVWAVYCSCDLTKLLGSDSRAKKPLSKGLFCEYT